MEVMRCEGDLSQSVTQVKVICGTFCTYDAFRKIDVHLRIQSNGSSEMFAYGAAAQTLPVDDWNTVYVSGQLRAFERPPGKFLACRHL